MCEIGHGKSRLCVVSTRSSITLMMCVAFWCERPYPLKVECKAGDTKCGYTIPSLVRLGVTWLARTYLWPGRFFFFLLLLLLLLMMMISECVSGFWSRTLSGNCWLCVNRACNKGIWGFMDKMMQFSKEAKFAVVGQWANAETFSPISVALSYSQWRASPTCEENCRPWTTSQLIQLCVKLFAFRNCSCLRSDLSKDVVTYSYI